MRDYVAVACHGEERMKRMTLLILSVFVALFVLTAIDSALAEVRERWVCQHQSTCYVVAGGCSDCTVAPPCCKTCVNGALWTGACIPFNEPGVFCENLITLSGCGNYQFGNCNDGSGVCKNWQTSPSGCGTRYWCQ